MPEMSLGEPARGKHVAQAFLLSVVVAGDQDEIGGGGGVELVPEFGHVSAEPFDRLGPEVAGRLDAGKGEGRDADAGELDQLLKDRRDGKKPREIGHPFQVEFGLLLQVTRFDQHRPRARGEVIAKVAAKTQWL